MANKIDVTTDTRIAIPVILDLAARMVIWTNLADPIPSPNNLERIRFHTFSYRKASSTQLLKVATGLIHRRNRMPPIHEAQGISARARSDVQYFRPFRHALTEGPHHYKSLALSRIPRESGILFNRFVILSHMVHIR